MPGSTPASHGGTLAHQFDRLVGQTHGDDMLLEHDVLIDFDKSDVVTEV